MSKKIEVGDTVYIRAGLGEGQTVKVEGLKSLPFGTGIEVTLDGDYYAYLNPANLEVVPDPRVERIADLEAQITRLQNAVKHHASGRAITMKHAQGLSLPQYKELEAALQQGAGLRPGDLDPVGGDDELPR